MKKIVALVLALSMLLCVMPTFALAEEAPTIVKIGTHWADGEDPLKINETTGNYTYTDAWSEADRLLKVQALAKVKEDLNVEIQFVQYAKDTQEELVLSVVAGNPVCDIAMMWGGCEYTVLGQNILQPLDQYADVFAGGGEWIMLDPVFGHNYFLKTGVSFKPRWPLIVNLSMLEKVDTLKEEDGTTLYPMELFERGEWTWSTFKDYLQKIQAYYNNTQAPDGAKVSHVMAYETDYRYAALSAAYANGGSIIASDGHLAVADQEMIDAVAFIRELRDLGVCCDPGVYDDGFTPQWLEGCYDFGRGATVFTDIADWTIGGQANARTEAGESVALMPYPRADRLAADDPAYQQVITVGDLWGVLKGIEPSHARVALEAFRLYWETYYQLKAKQDAGVEVADMDEYKLAMVEAESNNLGLDLLHPELGESILDMAKYIATHMATDYGTVFGFREGGSRAWDNVVGKGYYGIDGTQAYEVAINANMNLFTDSMGQMEAILGSNDIHDNRAPSVSAKGTATVAKGGDVSTVDFTQYFTAEDGIDGVLDPASGTFDTTGVDTATVGSYKVKGVYADKSGNEGSANLTVVVYDPDNTTAPTLTVKAELPTIAMDTDANGIDWSAYVDSAVDADGLDVKGTLKADLSNLDTFTPGDYPVTLTVTDYAGNTAEVEITVTVAVAE